MIVVRVCFCIRVFCRVFAIYISFFMNYLWGLRALIAFVVFFIQLEAVFVLFSGLCYVDGAGHRCS